MSLQDAASAGLFRPRGAKSSDQEQVESPFHSAPADDAVDQATVGPTSPFDNPYDPQVGADDSLIDGEQPDMRAARRRAWAIVGLAIVIPAAVASLIAWQLFGGESEPVPTVTRITTVQAEPSAQEVGATAVAVELSATSDVETPSTTAAAATTAEPASSETTTVAVSTDVAAATTADDGAATAAAEPTVDLSTLDPAARLAAWTDVETIEVLPGETLWLIAQNYDTTVSAIATLNGITDPETLSVGQQLLIPVGYAEEIVETTAVADGGGDATAGAAESATASTTSAVALAPSEALSNWHTIAPVLVEDGDSLFAIAVANNTTVEAIMALNGIADQNLIFVGDTLQIPVGYHADESPVGMVEQQAQLGTDATAASDDTLEEESLSGAAEDMLEE